MHTPLDISYTSTFTPQFTRPTDYTKRNEMRNVFLYVQSILLDCSVLLQFSKLSPLTRDNRTMLRRKEGGRGRHASPGRMPRHLYSMYVLCFIRDLHEASSSVLLYMVLRLAYKERQRGESKCPREADATHFGDGAQEICLYRRRTKG